MIPVFWILASVSIQPVDSLPALREALRAASPGARVTLAPGVYEGSLYLENLRAEKDRPIVISGGGIL